MKFNSTQHLLVSFLSVLIISIGCTTTNDSRKVITHKEWDDPTEDTLSNWSGIEAGLKGSVVSIDTKHPRSILPTVEQINDIVLTGWKGETLSAQVLLWNSVATEGVEYSFSDFHREIILFNLT